MQVFGDNTSTGFTFSIAILHIAPPFLAKPNDSLLGRTFTYQKLTMIICSCCHKCMTLCLVMQINIRVVFVTHDDLFQ